MAARQSLRPVVTLKNDAKIMKLDEDEEKMDEIGSVMGK